MTELSIRPAGAGDYDAFTALFPELGVDDPVPTAERFAREIAPACFVAERDGVVVGYASFQVYAGAAYVRNLAVGPSARRLGAGRALMLAVAARARAAGVSRWMLNVKPGNVPAIALYESLGMRRDYESHALKLAWARVPDARDGEGAGVVAGELPSAEDAAVERALGIAAGQIAHARSLGGRVILAARESETGKLAGVAVFDPVFPGAAPFHAATVGVAFALLRAMRPHRREGDAWVNFRLDGQRALAEALVAAGAELRLLVEHMAGEVPAGG